MSSLLLSILVARAVDSQAFGAFTVAFTVYSVAVLVSRSVASQPLLIRFAATDAGPFRLAAGRSAGAAGTIGIGAGAATLAAGLMAQGSLRFVLLAVALVLPGMLVHDAWRIAFLAQRRPQCAALLDAAWMILQLLGVAALLAAGADTAVPYIVAWGLAGLAAAGLGAYVSGVLPRLLTTRSWLRAHWDLTRFLLVEAVLLQSAYQGALLLVGFFGSLADVGALRGAQVVLGPVTLLASSAVAFAVPELSRRTGLGAGPRVVAAVGLGGVLAMGGLAWGVTALLLPESVGAALLGDSWDGVRGVLFASVVGQVGNLLSVGPATVFYAMGRTDLVFRVNAMVSVLLVAGGMVGLWLAGAEGAAFGFAAAYWAAIPVWGWRLVQLRRAGTTPAVRPPGHGELDRSGNDRNAG